MRTARAGGLVVLAVLGLVGCGAAPDSVVVDRAVPKVAGEVAERAEPAAVTATVTVRPTVAPSASPSATPTAPAVTPTPSPTQSSPPPDPEPPADPRDVLEAEVVELTNAERSAAGCPAVHVDERLMAASRAHSEDMVARDFFDHTNPDGAGPGDRARAAGYDWLASENIAWGYHSAEDVVEGWMLSPGHRRNILDCGAVAVGVGVADSSQGPYWTQMFGRR